MIPQAAVTDSETSLTRRRYDRVAPLYDVLERAIQWGAHGWRTHLWSRVGAGRILEVGVGTGKNIAYYPADREIVAMDISEKMLMRARRKAARTFPTVRLERGDVQQLSYPDSSFDVAVGAFVFCSVPDPVRGLAEVRRVLRPGGRLVLLGHVLSHRPVLRQLMQALDPIPVHLWGTRLDRDTVGDVRQAGFVDVVETNLWLDVVKCIEAASSAPPRETQAVDAISLS